MSVSWKNNVLILIVFLLICSFVYWNSTSNPFQFDDERVVVLNKNIQSLNNIPGLFTNPKMFTSVLRPGEGHYRPLTELSYAINYAFGKLNPFGYHLMNMIFHAGTAFLLFLIVKAMLENSKQLAAIAAGLIFLVHPFNSEAINYLTARSSVMSGFFYLLAFWAWIKFRSQKKAGYSFFYLLAILAFIAGMLSKEIVITLPIILWLYDLYFKEKTQSSARISDYLSYLPFILFGIVPYFLIRMASFGGAIPSFQRDLWTQYLTELPVLFKHWKMFILPSGFTSFHQVDVMHSFFVFPVLSSALFLTGYIIIAILLYRASSYLWRMVSFFMFWFFIVLLPTTIIPLNTIFQENRGYLAIVSFSVAVGILLWKVLMENRRQVGISLLVILILFYSAISFSRNRVWKDEITLWENALKKSPDSYQVYTALGVAYRRANMYNQSLEATRKALQLGGEENFVAHDNLGRIFMAMEKWEFAAQEFEKTLKVYPFYAVNHNDLGVTYFKLGKYGLAEQKYKDAINLDSNYYQPHFNAGVLHTVNGNYSEAIKEYQKAIDIYPAHIKSWLHIGILLDDMGKKDEALYYFKYVIKNAQKEDEVLAMEAKRRHLKIGGISNGG